MLKTSLLRQSAKKYATGNIKKSDYLSYRKDLLDAIDKGDTLPEIPEDWLGFKGSSMNPELQTLMTQMHEMDESAAVPEQSNTRLKIVVVAVIAVLLLAIVGFFLLSDDNETAPQQSYMDEMNSQVDNVFIINSRKIIPKNKWVKSEIRLITRQWTSLTAIQKTALKRHSVVLQLKSKAIQKLQSESDEGLKKSIQKLLDVIQ